MEMRIPSRAGTTPDTWIPLSGNPPRRQPGWFPLPSARQIGPVVPSPFYLALSQFPPPSPILLPPLTPPPPPPLTPIYEPCSTIAVGYLTSSPRGAAERLDCSHLNTHSIYFSYGIELSILNGYTAIGMFYPRGGTYWYRDTCSTMIYLMVIHRARLVASLYHPFILWQSSLTWGGYEDRVASMYPPDVAICCRQSDFRLADI